jgi:hypothetical protein
VTGTITGFVDYQITSLATTPTVAPQTGLTSTSKSPDPKNICHAGNLSNDKPGKDGTAAIYITKATLCDH